MLRILPPEVYKDLTIVSKIRNKFAHELSIKSFDDQQITDWVKSMHHYKMFLSSVQTFQEKAHTDPDQFRTTAYVLGDSARTIAGSYRESVRLIIHWLADYEHHIKSEEQRLNSGKASTSAPPFSEEP